MIDRQNILTFLMNNEFIPEEGRSYSELLFIIKGLKTQYLNISEKIEENEGKIIGLKYEIEQLRLDNMKKDVVIEDKKNQIINMKKKILKKLTLKERIFGKIYL
jgi:hypothetical protein